MGFIKLTSGASHVYLNSSYIITLSPRKGGSKITTPTETIYCDESPEQILTPIESPEEPSWKIPLPPQ